MTLRSDAFHRAGHYCERCGRPISEDNFALHHRKLRKHGGADEITNVLALCHWCHNGNSDAIHSRPADARDMGWMVSAWDDPAGAPVCLPGQRWALLLPNGGYQHLPDYESVQED